MPKPPPPSIRAWLQRFGSDMCRLTLRWFVMVKMPRLKRRYPDPEERWEKAEEAMRRLETGRE